MVQIVLLWELGKESNAVFFIFRYIGRFGIGTPKISGQIVWIFKYFL